MDGNNLDYDKVKTMVLELKKVVSYKWGKHIALTLKNNDAIDEMIEYLTASDDLTQSDVAFKFIDIAKKYDL